MKREERQSRAPVDDAQLGNVRARHDIRKIVGANIRCLRMEAGIAQDVLATRMGVDQAYVSKLEAGKRNPTITTVSFAARALGVDVGSLFAPEVCRSKIASSWPGENVAFINTVSGDSKSDIR